MKPRIVDREEIILLGFSFFGDPFAESAGWTAENEIGRLSTRFMAYLAENGPRLQHVVSPTYFYEVHIYGEESESIGHFEVFVGIEVEQARDVPVEALIKLLPAARYAVFTLEGEQITSDWPLAISDTLDQLGYVYAFGYSFQLYDERFKGLDRLDESALDVYVPVTGAEDVSPDGDR